ncbi:PilN domain-containing protein [Methylocucumis oryzae]|uniref:PilN domain-containing protein n=1 Tax=Methylocucumis oryzae TaxID=1632867 RepID=UPI000698B031|nr:PilN domain-containing protein [Methylocucumis oryzae]
MLNTEEEGHYEGELIANVERREASIEQAKQQLANDPRLGKAPIILRLSEREAISKALNLPIAAKENLTQVVAYELDRYTPFTPEQVYFAVIQDNNSQHDQEQLKALLILTPREVLDGLYEDCKALGLAPQIADYQNTPNHLHTLEDGYNLLPDWLQQKSSKTPKLIHASLIASIIVLSLTALILPVWLQYQTVTALGDKIKLIEKDAKKIKALESEIDAVVNESQKLIDEKNASPKVVEMLNTLSAVIKDDTWLSYLQYSDKHLQIQGESPSASTLIGVLEETEMFSKARFVSPVTQNKRHQIRTLPNHR